jgi:tRNA(Ile2)-agmatinylcytidine synthase
MGRNKGYRCKKCGHRDKKAVKITRPIIRGITEELYMPPPRAHRHLTKPLSRYGIEKRPKEPYSDTTQFWGIVE